MWIISHTLDLPSAATSRLMLKLTRGSVKQLPLLPTSPQECWKTPSSQSKPKLQCTTHVWSVLCSMVVRLGQHMPGKKKDSIPFTCVASAASLAYHGRTKFQTLKSSPVPTFSPCLPFSGSAGFAGLDMYIEWTMGEFPKTFCTESWQPEREPLDDLNWGSGMSAKGIWKPYRWTLTTGKPLQLTAPGGGAPWSNSLRLVRRTWPKPPWKSVHAGKLHSSPAILTVTPPTNATSVEESVDPASAYTATCCASDNRLCKIEFSTMVSIDRRWPTTITFISRSKSIYLDILFSIFYTFWWPFWKKNTLFQSAILDRK